MQIDLDKIFHSIKIYKKDCNSLTIIKLNLLIFHYFKLIKEIYKFFLQFFFNQSLIKFILYILIQIIFLVR